MRRKSGALLLRRKLLRHGVAGEGRVECFGWSSRDNLHQSNSALPDNTWWLTTLSMLVLAVTPETLVPEVGNMKDEIRRMQTFLGMGPAPNMATAPAAAPGQPAPAPDMPRSPEPWGQPGREPRQPSEPARNLGASTFALIPGRDQLVVGI